MCIDKINIAGDTPASAIAASIAIASPSPLLDGAER
jgi:hypothetical protein